MTQGECPPGHDQSVCWLFDTTGDAAYSADGPCWIDPTGIGAGATEDEAGGHGRTGTGRRTAGGPCSKFHGLPGCGQGRSNEWPPMANSCVASLPKALAPCR